MRTNTTSSSGRGRSRRPVPIRKRCTKCGCWVLPGVLVLGECPSCTGIQPLPLVDSTGRPLRPDTYPQVLPAGVTADQPGQSGGAA
jgi:hypothetical protein